jgi:endoglucanase
LTQLRAKDTGQPANGWGGYHDAGDWNPRRVTHLQVTNASMEILEMFPEKAGVLKWNIPQEFKGPDILIEAKWHLDCFKRLQQADGGVSFGLETEFDPYSGEVSWVQTMPIFAWWPDAWSSWVYAHSAFRFADLVEKHDKKMAQEYRSSALRAMEFAEKDYASRTAAGKKVRWEAIDARNVAALAAYRSTKSPRWHEVFLENTVLKDPEPDLYRWTIAWQGEAAFMYARLPQGLGDEALKVKAREALERKAKIALGYQKGNAFLLAASDPGKPMINGFFTGPHVEDLVRAHYLTRKPEYLEGVVKGALFSAGANPVGTTFTTGVGTTSAMAFKIDQRYTNQPIPEGLTIYGMCDYVVFGGSSFYTWPITWHVSRTAKPDPYSWPIQEALFETWLYPAQLEYTVDQWWPNVYGWGYLAFR